MDFYDTTVEIVMFFHLQYTIYMYAAHSQYRVCNSIQYTTDQLKVRDRATAGHR